MAKQGSVGGANPYDFVQNSTLSLFDALGLFQVDEVNFTITVEPNEIVILYGHQHSPPWKFTFKHKVCSAGGAIVCPDMAVGACEWAKAKAKWYGENKICGCDKVYIRYYRDTRKIKLP